MSRGEGRVDAIDGGSLIDSLKTRSNSVDECREQNWILKGMMCIICCQRHLALL